MSGGTLFGAPALLPPGGWGGALAGTTAFAMAFLAVITLAAALAAGALGAEWRAALEGSATVRLAAPDATSLARVVAVLEETEGVASARALDSAEQAALLAPWLGSDTLLEELPVPQLVDVRLEGAGPDRAVLAAALSAAAPGTVYDDHGAWRGPLIAGARAIERLAIAASLLVALAAAAVVALSARASLAGNAEIVRVIRLIGGEERFIARAFVQPLALRTGAGAFLGAAIAALALWFLPEGSAAVGLDLAPDPGRLAALALGVAVAAALIGWAAAQIAVRAALAELP